MAQMTDATFFTVLKDKFPHEPTLMQSIALQKLASYILSMDAKNLFLLKGFAGTGKTTLVGTLVNSLWRTSQKSVLMAPTGRAAKVMANYANTQAFTIHRKIYFPKKQRGGAIHFELAPNKHRDTIFIVDEASMIPDAPTDSKLFGNGSLLDDLLMFVYSGHNCKLILIGDTAQLPPVHLNLSPALDADKLRMNYNKEVIMLELDEVVRQAEDSGILVNATLLREQLQSEFFDSFKFDVDPFKD
ncbi:hypothetical protein LCGC14_1283920, partial [marine sediment metagenome]